MIKKNLRELELLTEAIKASNANIADDYDAYKVCAYAIAGDCGEAGRDCYHTIISISAKYERKKADQLYDSALKGSLSSQVATLGSVFYLAEKFGVDVKAVHEAIKEDREKREREEADPVMEEEMPTVDTVDPSSPLPCFPGYDWGWPFGDALRHADTPAKRDAFLLAMLDMIGATVSDRVRFEYSGDYLYTNLLCFIIAPSGAGKSIAKYARLLGEPLHLKIRSSVDEAIKNYQLEMKRVRRESRGEDAVDTPDPERPRNKMFIIAGNNTGTGMLENLCDSDGKGIIFETEADTVSTAIASDYGGWSDTLRKAFDHDWISYNRRTEKEYRMSERLRLSLFVTGTPAQLQPLVPSAENGLFSRMLFYYMPPLLEWEPQHRGIEGESMHGFMRKVGEVWEFRRMELEQMGFFTMELSKSQIARKDELFAQLFKQSRQMFGAEMNPTIVRLSINLERIMAIVGITRIFGDARRENIVRKEEIAHPDKDERVTNHVFIISEEDFQACMNLVNPLFEHAVHALSFLPKASVTRRILSEKERLFQDLPDAFQRKDAVELGAKVKVPERTVGTWLHRWVERGLLEHGEVKGEYKKVGEKKPMNH